MSSQRKGPRFSLGTAAYVGKEFAPAGDGLILRGSRVLVHVAVESERSIHSRRDKSRLERGVGWQSTARCLH